LLRPSSSSTLGPVLGTVAPAAELLRAGLNPLSEHVKKSGLAEKIELVISSPLLRYSLVLIYFCALTVMDPLVVFLVFEK